MITLLRNRSSKGKSASASQGGMSLPPGLTLYPHTPYHMALLVKLASPWVAAAAESAGVPQDKEAFLKRALRNVTENQVAEFLYVSAMTTEEAKTAMSRDGAELTVAAMVFTLRFFSREELGAIVRQNRS